MSERSALALRAVHQYPGCSAWALSVLAAPPDGMTHIEWRGALERELPLLHAAGKVQATSMVGPTTFGPGLGYWPAGYDVPELAGEVV